MISKVAILFSGGTDSTLTASIEQKKYDEIYLLSYWRNGISCIDNSKGHAEKLQQKYSDKKFEHHILDVDDLFKELSYENFLHNIKKHRFFLLSTCGFCKLAMHVRTLQFCLEHNIKYVCDGANRNMYIYPFQRSENVELLRDMYREFDITYYNPVFDLPSTPDESFYQARIKRLLNKNREKKDQPQQQKTVGELLYETGLVKDTNIKGSDYDAKHQAKCMQLFLFRIFALGYFIPRWGIELYAKRTTAMFKEKINYVKQHIIKKSG
jgi:predicted subunit of tRNA(5-methylaminomethyl-2-thiouridylate) methyltransferase